jgi:signal transduction histidine kinase
MSAKWHKEGYAQLYLVMLWWVAVLPYPQVLQAQQQERDSLERLASSLLHRSSASVAEAKQLAHIGFAYTELDSRRAVVIAKHAEALVSTASVSADRVRILNILGFVYRSNGQYREAQRVFSRALSLAKSIGSDSEIAWSLSNIGWLFGYEGKYDNHLKLCLEALQYAERSGDYRSPLWVMYYLSVAYRWSQQLDEAKKIQYAALQRCRIPEDNDVRGLLHNSYGASFHLNKEYRKALEQYRLSYGIQLSLRYWRNVGRSANNLGLVFADMDRYDSSLYYHTIALRLYEETHYESGLGNLLGNMAHAQYKLGRYPEAVSNAKRALSYCVPLNEVADQRSAYSIMALAYEAMDSLAAALEVHKRSSALQDSIYSITVARRLAELEIKQKEYHIQLLQSEQQRQSAIQIALLVGVTALFTLAVVLVRSNRRKKQDNAELVRQQALLEEQSREIEIVNAQLHGQNDALVELNNEKNEFLGIAAHDLKNPLSSIYAMAEMLLTSAHEMTKEQQEQFLSAIVRSSERMFALIKNLLDVNAIERDGIKLSFSDVNLLDIAQQTLDFYQSQAEQKTITLHIELEEQQPASAYETTQYYVKADAQALQQVMDNLISNAVKYSPQGKRVVVRVQSSEGVVRVEVQDEGPGLSDEDKKKLFGKFARLSAQPTGGEHSTGLGLSIVKKLVEAMHGRVWCESELGKGATFIVELPRLTAGLGMKK